VETPVEQQVNLRDERVVVERRPASGTTAGGAKLSGEREFEVTERREEPVVEKSARPVEEVVVRKEANERVETVRDTVRETKVDVDKSRQRVLSIARVRCGQTAIRKLVPGGCLFAAPAVIKPYLRQDWRNPLG
jgi:stress response protein YsnF